MHVFLALCVFLGMRGIFGLFGFLAHPGTFRQAWIHLGERRFFCGCTDTFGHALVLLGTCRYFWAPDFFFFLRERILLGTRFFFAIRRYFWVRC